MPIINTVLFLDRPRKILSFFGIWQSNEDYTILVTVYMVLVMITQYSFVLFEVIYIAGVWGDMDAVSEASYLLFTQASVCYKTTAFLVNKKSLLELLRFMEIDLFQLQTEEQEK